METGWIKLHRRILDNDLWLKKPSSWIKVWLYILLSVDHNTGEGYFNLIKDRQNIGTEITPDKVKKIIATLRQMKMIGTKRSTRGMTIKVLNYAKYQALTCPPSTTPSTREAPEKHQRSTREAPEKHSDIQEDKNIRIKNISKDIASDKINELIKLFEPVNPSYKQLYKNTTERGALSRLVEQHGEERVKGMIAYLPKIFGKPYAPVIVKPYDLERKLPNLMSFIQSEKSKKTNIVKIN